MLSLSVRNSGVAITREAKTVTLSYSDIFEVVNRYSDEVLLDNGVRMHVLNTGRDDMEYCIRRCYNGKVTSSFALSRTEWQQVVNFAGSPMDEGYDICGWWIE